MAVLSIITVMPKLLRAVRLDDSILTYRDLADALTSAQGRYLTLMAHLVRYNDSYQSGADNEDTRSWPPGLEKAVA